MKKPVALVLLTVFVLLMTVTCSAVGKGDRVYQNLFFESAKALSPDPDSIILAQFRLKALDGSYLIYTYEINRKKEEMVRKSIEIFNPGGKSVGFDKTEQTFIYSHHTNGEQLGQDSEYDKAIEYISQQTKK